MPFRSKRAHPYVYTDDEVRVLLKAALGLSPNDALRKWTYHSLFGLLAVSGLRLSEALSLRRNDVDLKDAALTVRGTKFGKCCLVPSTVRPERRMQGNSRGGTSTSKADRLLIFSLLPNTRLDKNNVGETFRALCRQTGLRGEFDSRGPRLHDFRRRFAIRSLLH